MAERTNPYSGMSLSEIVAARAAARSSATTDRASRMAELKAQREAAYLQKSLARAQSNPIYNFTARPEGKIDTELGLIRYFGWSGGRTTGRWVKREAELNDINLAKYGSRVPAMQYAIQDAKSAPVPMKDISGKSQNVKGFTIDAEGKIMTIGNVDPKLLEMKSSVDQKAIATKAADREQSALARAMERAKTSPEFNFLQRPAGKVTEDKIYFYSWVGGKTDGSWRLYEADNNELNMINYKTRIPAISYYEPTSIRDTLMPKTTIFGLPQGVYEKRDVKSTYNTGLVTGNVGEPMQLPGYLKDYNITFGGK